MTILATLGPTITSSGISIPSYAALLSSLQASFQAIYGSSIYVAPDSQDGQLLALVANAINDSNQAAVLLYNAFSPSYAQGTQLSSEVKINGLARLVPSYSTCNVTITGVFGTVIDNGVVQDTNGNLWNLPAVVTIPNTGTIIVQATAQQSGAINSAIGTLTIINTPTYGWQTVTNAGASVPGQPVETDAALRVRQALSVSIPSSSILAGIVGAIANLPGVIQVAAYENSTNSTNSIGLPAHSISLVVYGGNPVSIAQAIANQKTPGTATYGTTSENITDPATGIINTINFYTPTSITMSLLVNAKGLTGYTTAIGTTMVAALAAYVAAQVIGSSLYISKETGACDDAGSGNTFNILSIYQARSDMVVTGGPYTAGATTVNVTGASSFIPNGSKVTFILDNGVQWPVVVSGVAGTAVTFSPAIPTSRSIVNGSLAYVNADIALAFNELPLCASSNIALTVS